MNDDTISRQAAIDALKMDISIIPYAKAREYVRATIEEIYNRLAELPSVQPKAIRPKFVAEDRYIKNHFTTYPHCPKCNYGLETGDCYCKVCGCHIDWSEDDGR